MMIYITYIFIFLFFYYILYKVKIHSNYRDVRKQKRKWLWVWVNTFAVDYKEGLILISTCKRHGSKHIIINKVQQKMKLKMAFVWQEWGGNIVRDVGQSTLRLNGKISWSGQRAKPPSAGSSNTCSRWRPWPAPDAHPTQPLLHLLREQTPASSSHQPAPPSTQETSGAITFRGRDGAKSTPFTKVTARTPDHQTQRLQRQLWAPQQTEAASKT